MPTLLQSLETGNLLSLTMIGIIKFWSKINIYLFVLGVYIIWNEIWPKRDQANNDKGKTKLVNHALLIFSTNNQQGATTSQEKCDYSIFYFELKSRPFIESVSISHYLEVAQIFMGQNMRFGLILGRLAILKKKLGWLWATFEAVFSCFCG